MVVPVVLRVISPEGRFMRHVHRCDECEHDAPIDIEGHSTFHLGVPGGHHPGQGAVGIGRDIDCARHAEDSHGIAVLLLEPRGDARLDCIVMLHKICFYA